MQFIVVTYVLAALWMLVFALSALPVYFLYNMTSTCHTIDVLTETPASINQLCVDARQYGDKKQRCDAAENFIDFTNAVISGT